MWQIYHASCDKASICMCYILRCLYDCHQIIMEEYEIRSWKVRKVTSRARCRILQHGIGGFFLHYCPVKRDVVGEWKREMKGYELGEEFDANWTSCRGTHLTKEATSPYGNQPDSDPSAAFTTCRSRTYRAHCERPLSQTEIRLGTEKGTTKRSEGLLVSKKTQIQSNTEQHNPSKIIFRLQPGFVVHGGLELGGSTEYFRMLSGFFLPRTQKCRNCRLNQLLSETFYRDLGGHCI